MIDRRGILAYLVITFGLTYLIEGILILVGARFELWQASLTAQLVIASVMWVPALATVLTVKFVTKEPLSTTNLQVGPIRPYLVAALVVPGVFVVVYGLTWALGLGRPDWRLVQFSNMMESLGADLSEMPPPGLLLILLFGSSLVASPLINSLFGFGEEWGWRGFLLPRLMPLGKARSYILLGVIWGLWHAPLIVMGFNYPGYPLLGVLGMVGMTTALGVYINELTLRHRSTILAGWVHGLFNSQGYGIWRILFPDVNPLLGGITGLVGIAVWLAVGLLEVRYAFTGGCCQGVESL